LRQAAQSELAEFAGAEPSYIAEFVVSGCGNAADDLGLIDGGDVGDPVAIGISDLIVGSAEHVEQSGEPHFGPDLLASLTDGRLGRRLTAPKLHRTAGPTV